MGGNLKQAYFRYANLRQANLRQANLKRAVLSQANLTGTDLSGADLAEAIEDDDTVWPEGFDPEAAGVKRASTGRWRGRTLDRDRYGPRTATGHHPPGY